MLFSSTHTLLCVSLSLLRRYTALSTATSPTFDPGSPWTLILKLFPGVRSRKMPSDGPTFSFCEGDKVPVVLG